jgi:hypothetical protein
MDTPPVVNGDTFVFSASINAAAEDETPENNSSTLNQTTVGSYDPNDITCLEGNTVGPDMIGKYVHYIIRFENTGTYHATNIVVKDMVDTSKFDVSSLVPLHSSHDFITRIAGNTAEFIFENIMLPFDDAINDGYVAFKIKTKPTLTVGQSFSKLANIYFDYNHPIVTNTATTTITALATEDHVFDKYIIYPNPAQNTLQIRSSIGVEVQSVGIYNLLGQLVLTIPYTQSDAIIDVSHLNTGNYFIKIRSANGTSTEKFIKE